MNHLVIDASVFVAAYRSAEPDHASSCQFLGRLQNSQDRITCPILVLAEVAGAIARPTGDEAEGFRAVSSVRKYPRLDFADITVQLGNDAARIAASQRIRGADAVYVAVARLVNATLITLDREVLTRAAAIVPVSTPVQWIAGTRLPG